VGVKLPKNLAGIKFDPLFSIEMNDFNIEMVLPALFWLVRTGGKDRGTRTDPKIIAGRTLALSSHPQLDGFSSEVGLRVLDKWVRSSLIRTSAVGRQRHSEQIAYVQPLSFLSFKPAFPSQSSRLRQVPQFLYHTINQYLCRSGGGAKGSGGARPFDDIVLAAFARGVELDTGSSKDGRYDGVTPLDLEVMLQLYYLDGFEVPRESNREAREPLPPALPKAAAFLSQDIAAFLHLYATRIPTAVLARYAMALINFELFIYTLHLMRAANALVLRGDTPSLFSDNTLDGALPALDLYVDVTQSRGSRTDLLAQACLNRDLEEAENFLRSNLTLRTLQLYVDGNRDLRRRLTNLKGGQYILGLWDLRSDPDVRADARGTERDLEKLFRGDDENEENIPADVKAVLDHPDLDTLSRVVEILVWAQRKNGVSGITKWLSGVGGLARTDGVLRGNLKGRRVWRYVMSDVLLEALVQLAVISPDVQRASGAGSARPEPRSVTLSAFLSFLRERFGVLIDTPPSFDASTEAVAAAKENFAALKQRLRQMGLFFDLSDDFNAQRLYPRFTDPQVEPMCGASCGDRSLAVTTLEPTGRVRAALQEVIC
jgi:hypothetical protein